VRAAARTSRPTEPVSVHPVTSPLAWHPPRTVLEVIELVLTGALPSLPAALDLAGVPDLAALASLADPAHSAPLPAGPRPEPLLVEDAEGAPVARLNPDGQLHPAGPFTAGPLRSRRRGPGPLAEVLVGDRADGPPPDGGAPLVVAVPGPVTDAAVEGLLDAAATSARPLLLLAVVGDGRDGLPAVGQWRAVEALAGAARARGVPADVVPVAVPRLPGRTDALLPAVVRCWADAAGGEPLALETPAGPPGTVWPAFAAEAERAQAPAGRRGVTVFLTGLSGSGKSTVAKALAERLVEDGRRTVTLLDGDEVRRLLSHGLGFSREDRDLNIRRIGFVAAEVTRHGGVAICAPIAPFAATRAWVRAAVEQVGDFVLVHVATPLEECERRDRKGLYARARRGEIPDFTGISSPYEVPEDAALVLDTTGRDLGGCVDEVWSLLDRGGHLPAR